MGEPEKELVNYTQMYPRHGKEEAPWLVPPALLFLARACASRRVPRTGGKLACGSTEELGRALAFAVHCAPCPRSSALLTAPLLAQSQRPYQQCHRCFLTGPWLSVTPAHSPPYCRSYLFGHLGFLLKILP